MKPGEDLQIIAEDTDTITFPVWFTAEGVYNDGLRKLEEIERIVPLVEGLPLTKDHPPTPDVPEDATIYAYIFDTETVTKDGLRVGKGKATINKNEFPAEVERVRNGETVQVSLGYWYEELSEGGDYKGKTYSHIRTQIKPTHVAMLSPGTPAACPPPLCNIGLDHDKELRNTPYIYDGGMKEKIFIPGTDSQINDSHKLETSNMTEGTEPKKIVKTKEEPIGPGDIGIDLLIKENPCVAKLHDANKVMTNEITSLKVGLDKLQKEVETLQPFKEAAEELERKGVEVLRSTVQEYKVFKDEEVATMGRDQLEVAVKTHDSLKTTSKVKVPAPGKDHQTKTSLGLTVGVPVRDENGKIEWKT